MHKTSAWSSTSIINFQKKAINWSEDQSREWLKKIDTLQNNNLSTRTFMCSDTVARSSIKTAASHARTTCMMLEKHSNTKQCMVHGRYSEKHVCQQVHHIWHSQVVIHVVIHVSGRDIPTHVTYMKSSPTIWAALTLNVSMVTALVSCKIGLWTLVQMHTSRPNRV